MAVRTRRPGAAAYLCAGLAGACVPSILPGGKPSAEPVATRVVLSQARAQADRWLAAFSRGDNRALEKQSAFPFQRCDTGAVAGCSHQSLSRDRYNLGDTLRCLKEDPLLADALSLQGPLDFTDVREIFSLCPPPRPDALPVAIGLQGDGASVILVIMVSPGGVSAIWRDAEIEPEPDEPPNK